MSVLHLLDIYPPVLSKNDVSGSIISSLGSYQAMPWTQDLLNTME
jgi:hypothetical protein